MKPLQIFLDEQVMAAVQSSAKDKLVSKSVIVRWAIAEYLKKHAPKAKKAANNE